jgi:hypothetical protein
MKNPETENIESALSKDSSLLAEAVKAWCAAHPATARFVSLKGITSKPTAFRENAPSLGIAFSLAFLAALGVTNKASHPKPL